MREQKEKESGFKKFLMKRFPKYFNIHVTTFIEPKVLWDEPKKFLKVYEVDTASNSLTDGLGITDERSKELQKRVVQEFVHCNNAVELMSKLSIEVTHANEFYFVAWLIASKMADMHRPQGGGLDLLAALLGGGKGPSKD